MPTDQRRALVSLTMAGKKGIHLPQQFNSNYHQDIMIEGSNRKKIILATFGDSCGQKKDIVVFNDYEQYEGFIGEHYTQKIVSSVFCWLNTAEVVYHR